MEKKPQVVEAFKEAGILCSEKSFKCNNSALYAEKGTREAAVFDKKCWELGMESMQNIFKALDEIPACSLTLTEEVIKVTTEGVQRKIISGCNLKRKKQPIHEIHKTEIKTMPRIATQLLNKIRKEHSQKITSVWGLLSVELPLTRSDNTSGDNYRTYYFGDKVSRGKKTHCYHGRRGYWSWQEHTH